MSGRRFALELGTEELPAEFVGTGAAALAAELSALLARESLPGVVRAAGTPRRLIVEVDDLPARQEDSEVEHFGPPVSVAFQDGRPTRAAEEFGKRFSVPVARIERRTQARKGKEVEVLYFREQRAGRPTAQILAAALPALLAAIPSRNAMRWGWGTATFCRPVRWILALHGEEIVPFEFAGVASGRATRGHRFMSSGELQIARAEDLIPALVAAGVVPDAAERRLRVMDGAARLAASVGGVVPPDEALLAEVANLVEAPFPILGTFDRRFLELPKEVLVSEMTVHQRYFPVARTDGSLLNHFVIISGTRVQDPTVVAAGNARVIAARFADGRFLLEEDRRKRLEEHAAGLADVVFIQKLGTVADKVRRIRRLVEWLAAETGVPAGAGTAADRVAELCKADLVTRMVFEFPELAGAMGAHYARLQGESEEVARGIADHVLPRGADDVLPETLAGALAGLADRMDSLCGFFGIGETVTGAKDKYGLRRAAVAVLRILAGFDGTGIRVPLTPFIGHAIGGVARLVSVEPVALLDRVRGFFHDRLKSSLNDQFAGDVCNAVLAVGFDDVRDTIDRAGALSRIIAAQKDEPDAPFRSLTQAAKRVTNILRQAADRKFLDDAERERPLPVDVAALAEPVERSLLAAIDEAAEAGAADLRRGDYDAVLARLARLKPTLDGFFGVDSKSGVMVMVDDTRLRTNRLRLLARLNALIRRVADLSLCTVSGPNPPDS